MIYSFISHNRFIFFQQGIVYGHAAAQAARPEPARNATTQAAGAKLVTARQLVIFAPRQVLRARAQAIVVTVSDGRSEHGSLHSRLSAVFTYFGRASDFPTTKLTFFAANRARHRQIDQRELTQLFEVMVAQCGPSLLLDIEHKNSNVPRRSHCIVAFTIVGEIK